MADGFRHFSMDQLQHTWTQTKFKICNFTVPFDLVSPGCYHLLLRFVAQYVPSAVLFTNLLPALWQPASAQHRLLPILVPKVDSLQKPQHRENVKSPKELNQIAKGNRLQEELVEVC